MMLQKILIMMMLSNISVNYDVFYERILYKYFLMLKVKKTKKNNLTVPENSQYCCQSSQFLILNALQLNKMTICGRLILIINKLFIVIILTRIITFHAVIYQIRKKIIMVRQIKTVLVGDTRVGKSAILSRFTTGSFDPDLTPTIGASYATRNFSSPTGGEIKIHIWDTAGQEKFRSLAPMYYRNANVAILVYDVTSKESFEGLTEWKKEIDAKAPVGIKFVVVGNKIDARERMVAPEEGMKYARDIKAEFQESSAKSGEGVTAIFEKIANMEIENAEIIREEPHGHSKVKKDDKKCCR